MRVITGKYKGKHFEVPRSFKARPTTDFAKENLFNVLRAYLDFEETRALDLFAGTGSITLELLSRGCREVMSVERDRQHHAFIQSMLRHLDDPAATAICGDALRFISKGFKEFDFVFADPPYALRELPELPERVMNSKLLAPGGLFVLEHGKNNDFTDHPCFLEHRAYGSVNFSFFRRPDAHQIEESVSSATTE
ncbi:RsmD family RNA methyltransferase [Alloprevotella sp. oral taxon 473]|uniref:RsmD family RNA methyltransferase n=1 Tax=Alloprevotella sp. oral taxon 473 TaxID=712469 RepID=UPI0002A1C3EE|nr:RsmD family RNA methyltransferase [Alloprevotella sp. oral taxon 473]EKX88328.1 RNA methyltransferase, RsmD family [Alloprevotella sp. oral taxon 473 str. F0040]